MRIRKTPDQKIEKLLGVDAKYVHIGIAIGQRVAASLRDHEQDSPDVEKAYDIATRDMVKDERQLQLAAAFERLPAAKRFDILANLFPDDAELAEALEGQRQAALAADERLLAIESLTRSTRLNHQVDLALIPADLQVQIGLFEGLRFSFHKNDPAYFKREQKYAHMLTFASLGDCAFKLVHERRDYQGGVAVPKLRRFQEVRLAAVAQAGDLPSPIVNFYDRLVCDVDGEQTLVEHTYAVRDKPRVNLEHIGLLAVEGVQLFGANITT